MKVLALSGSLRAASINSTCLRAAAHLAPAGIEVRVHAALGDLPLFNPDLEAQVPPAVGRLRSEVAAAEALLIASPEYAHGVSGTIKNALDWLVSFEPFVGVPVALFNTSPRARHADAALRETLQTMSATIVEEACIGLPLLGARLDEAGICASPGLARSIRDALAALERGVVLASPAQRPLFPVR
jgi:NAD(P)H-dependent FMN reductase